MHKRMKMEQFRMMKTLGKAQMETTLRMIMEIKLRMKPKKTLTNWLLTLILSQEH